VVCALQGLLLAFEGRHEEEVAQQRRTLELDPQHFLGHWALGAALLNVGLFEEALSEISRARELAEGTAFLGPVHARALALAGRGVEARRLLAQTPGLAYQAATVFAALGEKARALDALRSACEAREAWVVALRRDPAFLSLRGEAGFEALVERVGVAA
jgi:tetratricopeptide (TPR) repeat protein